MMKPGSEVPSTVLDRAGWQDFREIQLAGSGLTVDEDEFVYQIGERLIAGYRLTDEQRARLGQIMEART